MWSVGRPDIEFGKLEQGVSVFEFREYGVHKSLTPVRHRPRPFIGAVCKCKKVIGPFINVEAPPKKICARDAMRAVPPVP